MRNLLIILTFLLIVFPTTSYAEFKWVKSRDMLSSTEYEDWYNSRVMGKSITFWRMIDYETLQSDDNGQYISSVFLQILDCTDLSLTIQFIEDYSDSMGMGDLVHINKLSKSEKKEIKKILEPGMSNYKDYYDTCSDTFMNGLGGTQDWWLELYEANSSKN